MQAHQTDTGRGQARARGALAEKVEREQGTRKGPGWFVNRRPKLAQHGRAVQGEAAPRPGEQDGSGRG